MADTRDGTPERGGVVSGEMRGNAVTACENSERRDSDIPPLCPIRAAKPPEGALTTVSRPQPASTSNPADRRWRDLAYLVGWDDHLVIKAGVSYEGWMLQGAAQRRRHRPRYKVHAAKGATVYAVVYPTACSSVRAESDAESWLHSHLLPAFPGKRDAARLLGPQGAGWTECYEAATADQYLGALVACTDIMRRHEGPHACLRAVA